MLNSEQKVQECDATDDDQGTVVRLRSLLVKKIINGSAWLFLF